MITLIQQVTLILGTLIGAITDTKTGYIYDWLTYPMILIGIITSISLQQINNLIIAGTIFVALFIIYKLGKIGGGDVKLFTAITLLNPYNDLNFIITTIFISALLSMIFYSTYYIIKYVRNGINFEKNKESIIKAIILGIILLAYMIVAVLNNLFTLQKAIILAIPFALGIIFLAFQNEIKENFFEKKIKLSEVEEDEILSNNNSEKILTLLNNKQLLEEKEFQLLKKHKIKEIKVMRNLPKFAPFIFLGTLTATYIPEIITIILF